MPKFSKYTTTEYNRFQRVKNALVSVFRQAQSFKLDLDEFLKLQNERVFDTKDYKKLTQYYSGKVSGFQECMFHDIQRNQVEWKHYYTNRNGKVIYVDKWEKLPLYIRNNGEFFSNHFWKQTPHDVKIFGRQYKPWGKPTKGRGMK